MENLNQENIIQLQTCSFKSYADYSMLYCLCLCIFNFFINLAINIHGPFDLYNAQALKNIDQINSSHGSFFHLQAKLANKAVNIRYSAPSNQ